MPGEPSNEPDKTKRKITFRRGEVTLVGNLFAPENFNERGHYRAIIVEGSLTSVKEQIPETYARKFARRGFVVLAFDYGHYGESGGEPRQLESVATKLSDLNAAVTYHVKNDDLPFEKRQPAVTV